MHILFMNQPLLELTDFFCSNPNCRNHKPVPKGMLYLQVLNQPVSPFNFDDRTTATEKMMTSRRTVTRRNFTDGVNDWWVCSDCFEKGQNMSESPINPEWSTAPYEMTFMVNNRSPWVNMVTTSTFPMGSGAVVYVRKRPLPVEEPVDSEELMYPI